jgi:hypothetical protein
MPPAKVPPPTIAPRSSGDNRCNQAPAAELSRRASNRGRPPAEPGDLEPSIKVAVGP